FAGRAGTALTSEIGLMRATDQLTAMEVMAVDPLRHVAAPRFLGGVVAMPLLAVIFSVIGLYGAQLVGVQLMGVDQGVFWSQMQGSVGLHDVTEGVVKSLVFGVACSLIAVHEGYHAETTAEGVGLAPTRTVAASSVITLLWDYALPARRPPVQPDSRGQLRQHPDPGAARGQVHRHQPRRTRQLPQGRQPH